MLILFVTVGYFFGKEDVELTISTVIGYLLLSIIIYWIISYIHGSVAVWARKDDGGENGVHPMYWIYYLFIYSGATVFGIWGTYD